MVANLAIAKSGAVVYPINVTPTPLEVALVAQDLGAEVPRGMRFVERAPMASYWPRRDEPAK